VTGSTVTGSALIAHLPISVTDPHFTKQGDIRASVEQCNILRQNLSGAGGEIFAIDPRSKMKYKRNIMALKLSVPTLNSPEIAQDIKDTILTHEPNAKIDFDMEQKTVTIEGKASEDTFKQIITATGHEVAQS
jgi:copper chaperone